jgi:hypothetical protein
MASHQHEDRELRVFDFKGDGAAIEIHQALIQARRTEFARQTR